MLIKNKYFRFFLIFFLICFFFSTNKVFSATIDFSPIFSTYKVGDTFKIKVNISSDKSVNAVAGKISFPKDTLSLISLSKSSSILNLWPHELPFSNSNGLISFEGVILDGFVGNNGNIVTLVFKAKKNGNAILKFSDVSILANDGKGTDIFSGEPSSASIDIEKSEDKIIIPEINENEIKINKNIISKGVEIVSMKILPDYSFLIIIITFLIIIILIIIYLLLLFFKKRKNLDNNQDIKRGLRD